MYKRYAAILISNENDDVLLGLRRDSGKLANPGGKIEHGEDPYCGATRELFEETGLEPEDIKLVKVKLIKNKKILLYLFKVSVASNSVMDTSKDPDNEFIQLGYFNPSEIIDQLHVPLDENVLLEYWCNT